jgi:hypothetical protein
MNMKRFTKSIFLALALALGSIAPALATTNTLIGFLYAGGVPLIIPSSGSFSTNGAVTLTTALNTTFASAYLRFPAGAICASSAAGLYYTVMSSTTVGTVYTNTYTSGRPSIPASPTAYTCGTAPGAYAQSTTAITLATVSVPANIMGVYGGIGVNENWGYANSSSTKTLNTTFGGSNILNFTPTTSAAAEWKTWLFNVGSASIQTATPAGLGGFGTINGNNRHLTIDTTTAQNVVFTGTLASASDFIVLERFIVRLYPQQN